MALFGDVSNLSNITGLNAGQLIALIAQSAHTARTHKKNCRRFAEHLRLIGNLLDQLNAPELRHHPETREPIERLEEAIRRGYDLVEGCGKRSFLYMMAMGWNVTYEFKRVQGEIDRCLQIVPLISVVHSKRVAQKLESIGRDQIEYTLDEEDQKVQNAILDRDPSRNHASVLEKSFSCSYPKLKFTEALEREKEKLKFELHKSQGNLDTAQCEMIQHLLQVTHNVSNSQRDRDYEKENQEMNSNRGIKSYDEWNYDLFGCCAEPYLCLKTLFHPCGTFSTIASVAKNRHVSSAEVCNELMAYSLVLSCCCYTCCIRGKLRNKFQIKGGYCDDFLSHLMCCCCALVQEFREIQIRQIYGQDSTKVEPPDPQYIEY